MVDRIPFDDFGGRGPMLVFAHANAYPPGVYRTLLTALANDYRVLAVQHRPLWSDSSPEDLDDWHAIGDDLVRFLDQQRLEGIIGVGHSLGAVAMMMAALERPDLLRALVLIEPVFLPPTVLELLVANATQEEPVELPIVSKARERRNLWPSQEAAFEHFRSKHVFDRWSDMALWDYVRYGTVADEEGQLRLLYSPEWEAHLYTLVPTGVWDLVPKISHPLLAMRGTESDTLTEQSWALWQRLQPQADFEEFVGAGHLLPMEQPKGVAAKIRDFVGKL